MSAMPGMFEPSLSTSDWQRCCTLIMVMVVIVMVMVMIVTVVMLIFMMVIRMMFNLRMKSKVEQSPSQGG